MGKTPLDFRMGDGLNVLLPLLEERAPYQKVLILSTLDTFENKGKKIYELLKEQGITPLNFIVDENFSFSLNSAGGLFSFPENTRAVLALDQRLFGLASYFATLKNIPCFLYSYKFITDVAFRDILFIKDHNAVDAFPISRDRTFIFDSDGMSDNEFIRCFSVGLINLTVRAVDKIMLGRLIGEDYDLSALSKLNGIIRNFLLFGGELEKRYIFMEQYVEVCFNLLAGNNSLCAVDIAGYIYSGEFFLGLDSARISIKILEEYSHALSFGNGLNIPNYMERAERISGITGYDENMILQGLYAQTKIFEKVEYKAAIELKVMIKKALDTVNELYKNIDDKINIDSDRLELAVRHAGDMPFSTNGMTAIRELGL